MLIRSQDISIHVPAWGTTPVQHLVPERVKHFNPRSRVGNDARTAGTYANQVHFNPRSRVGNDDIFAADSCATPISIHVPAWGTTALASIQPVVASYFNPRSRVGNDSGSFVTYGRGRAISIHVPAWGTTANFHKYSLFFYAINIIFLLFIIPSLFSLVLFMLLF